MTKAFHVPADLADKKITLLQVQEIIALRRRALALQHRLEAWPKRAMAIEGEIAECMRDEQAILAEQEATE